MPLYIIYCVSKLASGTIPSAARRSDIELALWHAMKNNWEMAHNIVQDINTNNSSWIHAYLHRFEGDLSNANYWYNRAGKKCSTETFQFELNNIIKSIFK